ncbi:MAG: hypothetical protein K9M80_02085 [Candidatus Marinimicrobia bacterium]|nr:hypothetical protein [Candidatus Neomarinimicrobiota bacterium]
MFLNKFFIINESGLRLLLIILLIITVGFSQELPDPDSVLSRIKSRYMKYENFECNAYLSLNIPNIRIPEKELRIYYKKPDQLRIVTDGFSIVPRLDFFPLIFLEDDSLKLRFKRREEYNSGTLYMYRTSSRLANDLMTIWTNPDRNIVARIESADKSDNYVNIDIHYKRFNKILFPDSIAYCFKLNKSIPEFSPPSINRPFGETKLFENFRNEKVRGDMQLNIINYKFNINNIEAIFYSDTSLQSRK